MKKTNIKNLKVWMLSITTAMALTMTNCGSKTEQLHLVSNELTIDLESINGSNKKCINFEDIYDLSILEKHSNVFSIAIDADLQENKAEIVFNTFEEVEEFISNCTNLGSITTITDEHDASILEAIPNPQKIKSIVCGGKIDRLDFLKKFPNTKSLNLYHAYVKDLDSIANLKNLEDLLVWHSDIENINALENLTNLESVNLSNSPHLENIDPIKNLTNISNLNLYDTKVKNIDILSNFKNLRYLTISNTDIEDFKALENLTELVGLKLSNTNLKSLYYLRNLKNLEKLDLSFNQLENIAIIKNFYKLKTLNLTGNKIPNEHIKNLESEKSLYKSIIFDEELDVVNFGQPSLLNNEKILKYTLKLTPEQKQQIIEGQLTNIDQI